MRDYDGFGFLCNGLLFSPWVNMDGCEAGRPAESAPRGAPCRLVADFYAVWLYGGIGTIWDLLAYGRLDNSINLIPLAAMDWWGYTLNAFMFMPLGFLLPLIWKSFRQAKKTVVFGFLMSLTIEICQLFCFRATDVDDLIMNTLGAFLGYLCWKLLKLVFPKAGEKAMELGKAEPWVYLFGGVLGIVLLYHWRLIYPG